ncbi:MAG: hypothetical protein H3C43_01765 [Leptonema sp. (in: Bacteria)]|nr:hypothetical protein [Leptonema sp. (in: bacteria)]
MNLKKIQLMLAFGGLLSLIANCGAFDKPEDKSAMLLAGALLNENFELNGHWNDGFADHTISAGRNLANQVWGRWDFSFDDNGTLTTTYAQIVEFDNNKKVVYHNTTGCTPANGTYGPNCTTGYSRVVWTYSAGSLYTCTDAYGKASLSDAKAAPNLADTSDIENSGCGSFNSPWSLMIRL